MLLIYAKHKGGSKYHPMDMTLGVPTNNLLYASMYEDSDRDRLEHLLVELREENKDWEFEIRHHK